MEVSREKENEVRFGDLWQVFKQCWALVLAVAILAGAGSFLLMTLTHKDAYTATATIWALGSNSNVSGGKTSTSDVSIGTYLINDYKELILTDSVLEDAIEEANSSKSIAALKAGTKVTNNEETRVMYVAVTSGNKVEAQNLANSIADVFCERVNSKSDEGRTLVSVWDYAKIPTQISNPVSLLMAVLVALVAAVAVYAVFLILHLVDDKINSASDVERYLELNLLGIIPNREDARRRGLKKKGYYRYGGSKKAD